MLFYVSGYCGLVSMLDSGSTSEELLLGSDAKGRVLLRIRVQPRASRTAVVGIIQGVLRLRLRAPPVDGRANAELLKFVGRKVLGLAPSALSIVRGSSSRHKVIGIVGRSEEEVRSAVAKHL